MQLSSRRDLRTCVVGRPSRRTVRRLDVRLCASGDLRPAPCALRPADPGLGLGLCRVPAACVTVTSPQPSARRSPCLGAQNAQGVRLSPKQGCPGACPDPGELEAGPRYSARSAQPAVTDRLAGRRQPGTPIQRGVPARPIHSPRRCRPSHASQPASQPASQNQTPDAPCTMCRCVFIAFSVFSSRTKGNRTVQGSPSAIPVGRPHLHTEIESPLCQHQLRLPRPHSVRYDWPSQPIPPSPSPSPLRHSTQFPSEPECGTTASLTAYAAAWLHGCMAAALQRR